MAALNFLLPLLLLVGSAHAQEPIPQWGTWHVIGPFHHEEGGLNMEKLFPPEKELGRMFPGKTWDGLEKYHRGKNRTKIFWTPINGNKNIMNIGEINFNKSLAPIEGLKNWEAKAIAFLYRQVYVKEEAVAHVHFGSDDGMRMWLNGDLVAHHNAERGLVVTDNEVRLHLSAGINHLLVKVGNSGGAWKFQMRPYENISQELINQSISRGIEFLKLRQKIDGSWIGDLPAYRNGQTALSVYTLLKSGMPPKHEIIQNALVYLSESPTSKTYSAGCHLMALAALPNNDAIPWMEEILGDLLSWQRREGTWAYPTGSPDLSTTQFAALGLRAAAQRGLKIKDGVWIRLAEGVMNHQLKNSKVKKPALAGKRSRTEYRDIAGFAYHSTRPMGASRGSMSAAGVATLAICKEALQSRIPSKLEAKVNRSIGQGMQWLEHYWSIKSNPGAGGGNFHYYLYGIERVGSTVKTEKIGNHNWYWEGARILVESQQPGGRWSDSANRVEAATCFSLLFLERASKLAFTSPHANKKATVAASDPEAGALRLRALVGLPASLWITNIDDEIFKSDHITNVQYLGKQGDDAFQLLSEAYLPEKPSANERFSARHSFEKPGIWDIKAIGTCNSGAILESGVASITITELPPTGLSSYPKDAGKNLVAKMKATVETSSGNYPNRLIDNRISTDWYCAANDAEPEINISFKRPLPVNKILFSPVLNDGWHHKNPRAMPKVIRIFIDRQEPIDIEVEASWPKNKKNIGRPFYHKKAELILSKESSIQTLKVQILEIENGVFGSASVGFSEIEFQGPKKRRSRRR